MQFGKVKTAPLIQNSRDSKVNFYVSDGSGRDSYVNANAYQGKHEKANPIPFDRVPRPDLDIITSKARAQRTQPGGAGSPLKSAHGLPTLAAANILPPIAASPVKATPPPTIPRQTRLVAEHSNTIPTFPLDTPVHFQTTNQRLFLVPLPDEGGLLLPLPHTPGYMGHIPGKAVQSL